MANSRKTVFLFLAIFIGLMAIFYFIWVTDYFQNNFLIKIAELNARLASSFLNLFGYNTVAFNDIIKSPTFSISIKKGCDGIEPTFLLVSAIAAFPIRFGVKWQGMLLGLVFLIVMNFVRIISLFLIGIYFPSAFEFMHIEFWQVFFMILAILTWLVWVQWAFKKTSLA